MWDMHTGLNRSVYIVRSRSAKNQPYSCGRPPWPLPLFCVQGWRVLLRGFAGVGCLIAAPFWDEGGTLV